MPPTQRKIYYCQSVGTEYPGNRYVIQVRDEMEYKNRFFLIGLMLIVLFGFAGEATADNSGEYQLVKSWETYDAPWGIAADTFGNVYVSITDEGCIEKYSTDGEYIRKWGSTGSCFGEFASPKGIAVDYSGAVFIADSGNHRIQKFDVIGAVDKEWDRIKGKEDGEVLYPGGVAIDESGNVYVVDTGNDRIQRFSPRAYYKMNFGTTGRGDGDFDHPIDAAIDEEGNIYVADTGNNRIQKFASDGTFITSWGYTGQGIGEFNGPTGIDIDDSGDVYVADSGNNRIQKFTSGGYYITEWGSKGSGDGEFLEPFGVAVDRAFNVYVADTGNHRIQKFKESYVPLVVATEKPPEEPIIATPADNSSVQNMSVSPTPDKAAPEVNPSETQASVQQPVATTAPATPAVTQQPATPIPNTNTKQTPAENATPLFPFDKNSLWIFIPAIIIIGIVIGGATLSYRRSTGNMESAGGSDGSDGSDGPDVPGSPAGPSGPDAATIEAFEPQIASLETEAAALKVYANPVNRHLKRAKELLQEDNITELETVLASIEEELHSLKECEEQYSTWENEGYVLTSLDRLIYQEPDAIYAAFSEFRKKTENVAKINRELSELKITNMPLFEKPDIRQMEDKLRRTLKHPDKLKDARKEFTALNHLVKEKIEEQKIPSLREKGKIMLKSAQEFGPMEESVIESILAGLESNNPPKVRGSIRQIEEFMETAHPDLAMQIPKPDLHINTWRRVTFDVKNEGSAHAYDVTFSFTDDFETKLGNPKNIMVGETIQTEIGIKPVADGNIPLEITLSYQDKNKKRYRKNYESWINVENRDTASSRPKGPVSDFSPKPSMAGNLPAELADKYSDTSFLGKGGFARVFKATRKDGKEVAVKIPISLDASTGKSFIAEMQNWTQLKHPNIVQIYDYNIMPIPYFEMELCDRSLNELEKPLESNEASWIIFNACEGLKYTHSQKIIHRDLKLRNILLKDSMPKIADWGLSKVLTESKTSTGTAFTLYYAAPEQISNNPKTTATDIWQMGVIFYELMTNELPFSGESLIEVGMNIAQVEPPLPSSINPEAAPFDAIIRKCLEKDPKKRYQSAYDLQVDLSKSMNDQYAHLLQQSITAGDAKKSAAYCGELILTNLRTGDLVAAQRYANDLSVYAKGDVKELAETFAQRLEYLTAEGLYDVPDELVTMAELIVHKVWLGLGNK